MAGLAGKRFNCIGGEVIFADHHPIIVLIICIVALVVLDAAITNCCRAFNNYCRMKMGKVDVEAESK
jgi:hypothetical protein